MKRIKYLGIYLPKETKGLYIKYYKTLLSARFGSTYTKIGTIQRRLAWPLRKNDKFMKRSILKKKKQKTLLKEIKEDTNREIYSVHGSEESIL